MINTHLLIPITPTNFIAQIELKLLQYAMTELNNLRYGFQSYIDYDKVQMLLFYKDLYLDLSRCKDCFCDVNIGEIEGKIHTLLNTYC